MAAQRLTAYRVDIEDRPGALQELLAGFAEADINILNLAAFSAGGGMGAAYMVPDNPGAFKEYIGSGGMSASEYAGFILSGADMAGVGAAVTRPLAAESINIAASTATVEEGTYYLLIIVSLEDAAKTDAALAG